MQKVYLTICILLLGRAAMGQVNGSLPIPLPVPMPQGQIGKAKKTGENKGNADCNTEPRLIAFSLPCCIDTTVMVASIAKLTFDPPGCPQPEVIFTPSILTITGPYKQQTVTASAGDTVLVTTVNVVGPYISTLASADVSFAGETERLKQMMNRLKNGSNALCEPIGSVYPTGNLQYRRTYLCCENSSGCVGEKRKYKGSYSWTYTDTCTMPLYGFHDMPLMSGRISAQTTLNLSIQDETDCSPNSKCTPVTGQLTVTGSADHTSPGIIANNVQLQADGGYFGEYCYQPTSGKPQGKFTGRKLRATGSVTEGWGLVTHKVEYTIYEQW